MAEGHQMSGKRKETGTQIKKKRDFFSFWNSWYLRISWKTVLRKLCKERVKVSSQFLVKKISNAGFSSGFLMKGRAARRRRRRRRRRRNGREVRGQEYKKWNEGGKKKRE